MARVSAHTAATPSDAEAVVRARLADVDAAPTLPLVDRLRSLAPADIAAVVLYGSQLAPELATPTSVHDFFVVVDGYPTVLTRARDRVLARVLPPNVYRLRVMGPDGPMEAKYCVISRADLARETSARARDFYHVGRFSKRIAVVWRRDEEAFDLVARASVDATRMLVPFALAALPASFVVPDFSRALLGMSYRGEVRPESPAKVERIRRAEAAYYDALHRAVLAEHVRRDPSLVTADGVTWTQSGDARAAARRAARAIARSRRRSVLRWPKQMLLFDDWFDFLLAKVERTWGVDVRAQMTPRELRHPLVFGWPRFFRLVRQGRIR
jgi:hypothetical protein